MKRIATVFVTGLIVFGTARSTRAADPGDEEAAGPDVQVLLEQFDSEPGVRAVQKRALDHAGFDEGLDQSTAGRARLANLVPNVDLDAAWLDQDDSELRYREEIETDDDGYMRRDSARNRYIDDTRVRRAFSVEAEFELGGLVFERDEVAIARENRRRIEARRKLVARVTRIYFQRRHKQALFLASSPASWKKRLELRLAIQRRTAQLDGLTGGWFEERLESDDD